MASASDCPGLYDLVIAVSGGNTTGYIFDDAVESSLPFRTHKATYSYTPTFIERQNVQGDFGDNQQDFFLTATQRDWTEGEQQRYFRQSDGDSQRRFWQGDKIDVSSIPGQVMLRSDINSPSITTPLAIATGASSVCVAGGTNLYTVGSTGTVTDKGAHGLGTSPVAMAGDQHNVFLSATGAGTVGVRKWNGTAFSTFSASGSDSLAYLNNTLYGYRFTVTTGDLVRYDTAGALTSLFTWKDSDGTIEAVSTRLQAFGGKLLILRAPGALPPELWIYDSIAPSKVAEFQSNFVPSDIKTCQGTVYISGWLYETADTVRPVIFYYSNGTTGLLWKATSSAATTNQPGLLAFWDGLVFNDDTQGKLLFYSPALGGVHPFAAWTPAAGASSVYFAAGNTHFVGITAGASNVRQYPASTTVSSGSITTSLFDFDSSLTKFFRGVTVEFDSATDGNGGSVDISYRVGDVVGSYTSLATGVTSGSENLLSGVSGRSISVKVTLNKGTSTSGPVLKRIMVRTAPLLTRFKSREYILNCTGNPGTEDKLSLRDGSAHPLSGRQQVDQLVTASASQSALTITDRLGSFSGVIESLEIYEEHASKEVDPSLSGTFVCKVIARGI